jgi:hypothetical protein
MGHWQRLERELLQLKADLPLGYVRREDHVQVVASILSKLDAMAMKFERSLKQTPSKGMGSKQL